jgi:hypothetical protein
MWVVSVGILYKGRIHVQGSGYLSRSDVEICTFLPRFLLGKIVPSTSHE